ncbi:ExbD/TolR family protein [Aliiglaciecola lipolytica]|uniref:Biopolymer transport protein exbD2 n=1 Tax=Aliiglaciecola lipolytica E3 TaxID=1127673 RepID=K6WWB4_9ALTE|nr:biopolymer transporter ExbD [Aliiglaciecola lipolytica]GAC12739.1 biopolymer transport protein exbD2 [Aliiglaciecola lipolytica E3]
MRSKLEQQLAQPQQNIDLSPLLDVVFILLIFFIVTTVFVRETGIEVDKPQAVSSEQLQQNVILIAISDSGDVVYDNANIGVAGVLSTVSQLLGEQNKSVVIQADKSVPTELLVKVIDQAKLAGARQVNIATQGS